MAEIKTTILDGGLGVSSGSRSSVIAVVGVSGIVPADIVGVSDPGVIEDTFGDGPVRDFLEGAFSIARPTVYVKAVAGSVAGTKSAVVAGAGNTGVGSVTVAGDPRSAYAVKIEIQTEGGLNAATFIAIIDGVAGKKVTIPTGGTCAIPGTGLTLTFVPGTPEGEEVSFAVGDAWEFTTTEPAASNAELLDAIDAIIAAKLSISGIYVAGVTNAAFWSAFNAVLDALEAENVFLYGFCQARYLTSEETVASWVNLLAGTERGEVSSIRVGVVGAWVEETDIISGAVDRRGFLGKLAGRVTDIEVHKNPEDVGLGPISGVNTILPAGLSDADIERLAEAGYLMVRKYNQAKGIYIASSRLLSELTSDYKTLANRRVMDEACRRVVERQFRFLNSDVAIGSDGSPEGIAYFQQVSEGPVLDMKGEGKISGGEVVIPEGQNILSTETIRTKVRIVPRGKIRVIENEVSFTNPALEES